MELRVVVLVLLLLLLAAAAFDGDDEGDTDGVHIVVVFDSLLAPLAVTASDAHLAERDGSIAPINGKDVRLHYKQSNGKTV